MTRGRPKLADQVTRFTFLCDNNLLDKVKTLATVYNISTSELIRDFVEDGLRDSVVQVGDYEFDRVITGPVQKVESNDITATTLE